MTDTDRKASERLRRAAKVLLGDFVKTWREAERLDPHATRLSEEVMMGQLAQDWSAVKRLLSARDQQIAADAAQIQELQAKVPDADDVNAAIEIHQVASQAPPVANV